MSEEDWDLSDHWIRAKEAPKRIHRSRRTIYRWIAEGRVRSLRPSRDLWVSVPDLLRADGETIRRIRGAS